jgi:hypothetical protein
MTHDVFVRGPWRERLRRFWRDWQWYIIGALWVVAIVLGYIGYSRTFSVQGESIPPADILYKTLLLFKLNYSLSGAVAWELEVARFLAPAVALFTVIQAFAAIYYRQIQISRMRFASDHAVICGLGLKGLLLARAFYDHGFRVVVIERGEVNPLIEECRAFGAVVLTGNATDPEMLRKARVDRARYLVSVFGDDGPNAEVAVNARALTRSRHGKPLTCLVHIVDLQLCNMLREEEMRVTQDENFRLEFFNVFDLGALALLQEHPPFELAGVHGGRTPHLLVVGMGCLGESIVMHATRNLWLGSPMSGEKPRITVIDIAAENRVGSLILRCPRMGNVCELRALQMDTESLEFARGAFLFDADGECDVSMVYICLDNDSHSLTTALTLLQQTRTCHIPIVVRMIRDAGLATLLRGQASKSPGFSDLHAFGLLERTCTLDLLLGGTNEVLARAIHAEYLRNRERQGVALGTDPAVRPWDELREDLKESNRRQADHIGVKLRAVGCGIAPLCDWDAPLFEFTPEEVEKMAEMEHRRWVEERLTESWSHAPGPKDLKHKTSPYLVPWDELPEDIKDLDRNTVREIPSFLARAGFQVCQMPKD